MRSLPFVRVRCSNYHTTNRNYKKTRQKVLHPNLHKKIFDIVFWASVSFWQDDNFSQQQYTLCIHITKTTISLILSNVKIPSPLARVKMKRAELFSENGDSTRIFWSLCELWNSVSFWNDSFTFICFQRRVSWKKVLSFQIFSALFF